MPRLPLRRRAFTLIELLVVIAIIAILIGLLLRLCRRSARRHRESNARIISSRSGSHIHNYPTENKTAFRRAARTLTITLSICCRISNRRRTGGEVRLEAGLELDCDQCVRHHECARRANRLQGSLVLVDAVSIGQTSTSAIPDFRHDSSYALPLLVPNNAQGPHTYRGFWYKPTGTPNPEKDVTTTLSITDGLSNTFRFLKTRVGRIIMRAGNSRARSPPATSAGPTPPTESRSKCSAMAGAPSTAITATRFTASIRAEPSSFSVMAQCTYPRGHRPDDVWRALQARGDGENAGLNW